MLVAHDVALDLIRALRPVVAQLRRYSPEAADQVERAARSESAAARDTDPRDRCRSTPACGQLGWKARRTRLAPRCLLPPRRGRPAPVRARPRAKRGAFGWLWRMAARGSSAARSTWRTPGAGRSRASRRTCCSFASWACCGSHPEGGPRMLRTPHRRRGRGPRRDAIADRASGACPTWDVRGDRTLSNRLPSAGRGSSCGDRRELVACALMSRSKRSPESAPKRSGTFAVASIPRCQVSPTGPLSRVGRVDSRALVGGSVFDDICSKIFAMRSRISACRASGASPTGSGGPYTQ